MESATQSFEDDPVTQLAVEAVQTGTGGARPMYEAARNIAAEEEGLRQQILLTRQSGTEVALPPDLFPADVFNPDGSRKMEDGRYLMTPAEDRAWFELQDSRF